MTTRMTRFVPSIYSSYGPISYGAAEPTAEVAVEEKESSDPGQYKGYVELVGTSISSLFGLGKSERESAATIGAKIENLRREMRNKPSLGHAVPLVSKEYYQNEINKLQAQLAETKKLAGEEEQASKLYMAMRIGGVAAVLVGVVVLGGIAVNQLQRARLTQAEIERVRGAA